MNCLGENCGRLDKGGWKWGMVKLCWTACALVLERGKDATTRVQPPCCAFRPSLCLARGRGRQYGGGVTICSGG